jgi:DNA-binding beta-propeller fold protein YncE
MCARTRLVVALLAVITLPPIARAQSAQSSFVEFESGQVRPLALSPDGTHLFAANTPDNRLEIFDVATDGSLLPRTAATYATHTVPVGLEPVAVAARTNTEVWVVNHLSDSVSIVDLSGSQPRVRQTLLVGDEPRDIVFAQGGTRAFITCAHRGQQRTDPSISSVPGAGDPQLTIPGVGRADVWAFDATNPGTTLGGTPLSIITLFGDTPRALAVSSNGATVFAAVFHSGNQTTAASEGVVCNGGASAGACTVNGVTFPGGLPAPNVDANNVTGPETGLVLKFNGTHWVDTLSRTWDNAVQFSLPDDDVFRIDATQNPPRAIVSPPHDGQPFAHVGTVLFNMVVNPSNGHVYVTNGDARNDVRFEGQRSPCSSPTSVVGHLSEARITVLDPVSGSVTPRHLNKHLDSGPDSYCTVPSPAGTADASLSTPLGMAVTSNGSTLYVAAFGSSDPASPGTGGQVGVFSTTQLEAGTFTPSLASHILLSGGGASGLVLNEARNRLYVLTRFDNAASVVDT